MLKAAQIIAQAIDRNTRATLALARLLSERLPPDMGVRRVGVPWTPPTDEEVDAWRRRGPAGT